MGHRQVGKHGLPRTPVGTARHEDQNRGDERHRLPTCEKRQRVTRAKHEGKREHEQRRQRGDCTTVRSRSEVAHREHERRRGYQAENAEKQSAQPVDAETRNERARERVAEHSLRPEHPEARNRDTGCAGRLQPQPSRERPPRDAQSPTECNRAQPHAKQHAVHEDSRSCKISCCSASWRLMIERPASSRSNTCSSSTR